MTATAEPTHTGRAELELAVQRIRLRLGLRVAWLSHLSQIGLSDTEIVSGDRDRLDDELAWRAEAAPDELLDALTVAEQSLGQRGHGRLGRLAETFGLSPVEVDLVHVCLAAAVDERVGRVFARLHGDDQRRYVTEHAAARVCDRDTAVLAAHESPVRLWGLVLEEPTGPGEPPAVRLDRTVLAWLHDVSELDPTLIGVVRDRAPHAPLGSWPLDDVAGRCQDDVARGQPTRVVIRGRPGSGRRSFAAAVCDALGLRATDVDADRIRPDRWEPTSVAMQRHAWLERTAPIWAGDTLVAATWSTSVPPFPIQFACVGPSDNLAAVEELTDVVVDMPPLTVDDRSALWSRYVPTSDDWPELQRSDIVDRPHLLVGDIVHVARQGASTTAAAREVLRQRIHDQLGPLVTPMPLPYRRADLVVPDRTGEQLDFLLFECRQRRRFWAGGGRARLYPEAGLIALLAGPPGVGKTMAAQVLAGELGVPLLRVNLAETISKYIGETAKHLELVLDQARDLDALLLFDEADTLFGKRTEIRDAHDRWANADTNFLLQAIETYPGVGLLATNRKDQIDEAFLRRLRHVVELPRPDSAARRALWLALLADVDPDADPAPYSPLVDRLAERVELTGAEIKHAVLNAAFVAAGAGTPPGPDAIVAGLDRELAKQGRPLSELERRRVLDG